MSHESPSPDLSESFLHFLEDEKFNQSRQTFCSINSSNTYHDSSYRWCKICNKIFCTRCSLVHLLDNQITHIPIDKVFLSKEHLDVEFNKDYGKLEELKQNIEVFFTENKNSQNNYNFVNEIIQKFQDFVKELINILEIFKKKIIDEFDNIEKQNRDNAASILKENNVRASFKEIQDMYLNIEKKYMKNPSFNPDQMKLYYDELSLSYEQYTNLNEVISKYVDRIKIDEEINNEFDKLKNKLNIAINHIKSCSTNIRSIYDENK